METLTHGFCTREGWTGLFTDYNMAISDSNEASYGLIQSDLPAEEWVERYRENSARVREAFVSNEEMLNRHVRWFKRQPEHWTRETADPLLCSLFRYITRVRDLGTTYEIADSLIDFYIKSGDDIGLMKCYTVRAMSCAMLEPIHLGKDLFEGGTHNQRSIEAVEAMQLAAENVTHSGARERELYDKIHSLFISYLSSRPYTTFIDYICGSQNYCYILSAMPHYRNTEELLCSLLRLTMFRQVQTAMHSIMVAKLSVEILNSVIDRRPDLMAGQLGTSSAKEVAERRNEFIQYIYCGALLHDIGKVLCSSVINAQSHRLGELEFCVLKYHPVTGGEMLEHLKGLSRFRDIALGHQKSISSRSATVWMPPRIIWGVIIRPRKNSIRLWMSCGQAVAAATRMCWWNRWMRTGICVGGLKAFWKMGGGMCIFISMSISWQHQ